MHEPCYEQYSKDLDFQKRSPIPLSTHACFKMNWTSCHTMMANFSKLLNHLATSKEHNNFNIFAALITHQSMQNRNAGLLILPLVCTWQTEKLVCWKVASIEQGFPSRSAKHKASLSINGQYQIHFHCLKDLSLPALKFGKGRRSLLNIWAVY